MAIERRRILYDGRVQGVGFRMTTQRLASGFVVSGSVRNLPDGRVELVAQGETEILTSFLRAVQREFGDMIRNIEVEAQPPEAEAAPSFTIRYRSSGV